MAQHPLMAAQRQGTENSVHVFHEEPGTIQTFLDTEWGKHNLLSLGYSRLITYTRTPLTRMTL